MNEPRWIRCCAVLLCALLALPPAGASQLPAPPFRVNFLEGGDGSQNNVRGRRPVDIALQILDERGDPVRGAEVTFIFPAVGATLQPPGGGSIVTARTDDDGRVRVAGLIPFGTGSVSIQVRIRAGGHTQVATITHNNVPGPFMTPAKWNALAVGGAIAGATLGVVFATRKDNSARITLGPSTVGPRP